MAAPTSLTTGAIINPITGGISTPDGISSDGFGGLSLAGPLAESGLTGAVQTLATGNTIAIAQANGEPAGVVRVTAAAAVTGIILPVGVKPFQRLTVVHEGAAANTITFAAGVANTPGGPADGASDVITGPAARTFVWDGVTGFWYKCA